MKGGVLLVDSIENNNSTGIDAILYMMKDARSVIKPLTFSSLKGFLFELNVDKNVSRHKTLGDTNEFDTLVTNYIFKIVAIDVKKKSILPPFNDIYKECETQDVFTQEAILQQEIYTKSIVNGCSPICPSIATFSILNNENALEFIKYVNLRLFIGETKYEEIIEYLQTIFDRSITLETGSTTLEMGLIVMPSIINSDNSISTTYRSYLKSIDFAYNDSITNLLVAQVIRLLFLRFFHFDLHSSNALVTLSPKSIFLIDFGRASNLLNNATDEYYKTVSEKQKLLGEILELEAMDKTVGIKTSSFNPFKHAEVVLPSDFIRKCIHLIIETDRNKNQSLHTYVSILDYQMKGWLKHIDINNNDQLDKIYKFYKLISSTKPEIRTLETINKMQSDGSLFVFKQDDYHVHIQPLPSEYLPKPTHPIFNITEITKGRFSVCNGITCAVIAATGLAAYLTTNGLVGGKKTRRNKIRKSNTRINLVR